MAAPLVVRHGDGDVVPGESWLFKAVAASTDGLFDLMVGPVARNSGPPLHVHAEQSDSFLVLDGVLTIQIDGELHELGPGDFACVPPGTPHTFDNLGEEDAHVVNLMVPGGLHDFFVARSRAGDLSGDARRELATTYGMTVVGPAIRDAGGEA